MSKRTFFIGLVFLCLISAIVIYLAQKSPVGNWYGFVTAPDMNQRFALTVEKDAQGKLTCYWKLPDYGVSSHGPFLAGVSIRGRSLGWENTDGSADLRLDWTGDVLQGKHKINGRDYPMTLRRGMNFVVPRLGANGKAQTHYDYRVPRKMGDGWEVSDLRKSPADLKKIAEGIEGILNEAEDYSNIRSVVVVLHGKLVLDEYFFGYGPQDEHPLQSVTKSVLSTLFGIAFDQGLVRPDQKLYDFFPEYRDKPGWDKRKDKITLEMLLTMSSGFNCNDWKPFVGCTDELYKSRDWLSYFLNLPLVHEPGRNFSYCTSCMLPLGNILARKSELRIRDFAQQYLYDPLGIKARRWYQTSEGNTEVGGSHWLRPRDMAKLGLLYLNKGKWNGKQVVSKQWVEKATNFKIKMPTMVPNHRWDYGYLWWLEDLSIRDRKLKSFSAQGMGGQFIFVVPDLDLVVALTSGNFGDTLAPLLELNFFERNIVSAFL